MKIKHIILLIILSSYYLYTYSQEKWEIKNISTALDTLVIFKLNESSNLFYANFIIEDAFDNADDPATIYKLKIYSPEKNLIQEINDTISLMGDYSREMTNDLDLDFIDINMDGYKDIKVRDWIDMRNQSSYKYYLFNKRNNKFTYSANFSDLCCYPTLNYTKKEIYLESYSWVEEMNTKYIYKIINNEPILNEIDRDYVFTEDSTQKYRTVIEKLIDGEMKVVIDTTVWK